VAVKLCVYQMFAKIIPGEMYFPVPENLSPVGLNMVRMKSTVFFLLLCYFVLGDVSILHNQDLKTKPSKKSTCVLFLVVSFFAYSS
jgi:hypothetical protein